MRDNKLKQRLKSIIMNDDISDQQYYDLIVSLLHENLDILNKPLNGLIKKPIFQPGDIIKTPTWGNHQNHYAILIDLHIPKNIAVIRYITHNENLHPEMMIPVESRFLEGYFLPYNVMIPLTAIEKCCFPYDNLKQFKQLKNGK